MVLAAPAPGDEIVTVYLHATIELKPDGVSAFNDVMARFAPLLEAEGWRLEGAYHQKTGKLRTVIDIWKLESLDHFDRALKAVAMKPEIIDIKAALDAVVLSETLVFMDAAPFMHSDP